MENVNTNIYIFFKILTVPNNALKTAKNLAVPKKAWGKYKKKNHFLTFLARPSPNLRSVLLKFLSFRCNKICGLWEYQGATNGAF